MSAKNLQTIVRANFADGSVVPACQARDSEIAQSFGCGLGSATVGPPGIVWEAALSADATV
ncbi:MAG: hypothetical protein IJH04_02600 [Eggerthellaceae bacterium]|nr:hypothetical protein [Eggerthellaceae bacterium]